MGTARARPLCCARGPRTSSRRKKHRWRPGSKSPSPRWSGSARLAEAARRKAADSARALHRFPGPRRAICHRGVGPSGNIAGLDHQDRTRRRCKVRALLELFNACRRKQSLSDRLRALHRSPRRNRVQRICKCGGDLNVDLLRLLCFLCLLYFLDLLSLMTLPSRLRWLWLTLAVALLDRATKAWFESQTVEGWRQELIRNFIYLVHSRNPGLAFGIFSDSASAGTRAILILGSVVVIGVLAWLLVASPSGGAKAVAGLALLLGGATGNVTDRILHGAVTDFFELWFGTYRYPAFNVADSAIFVGAVLILLDVLFGHKQQSPQSG